MLLPVLKPATWDGLRGNARVHVWIGTPLYPTVVVAYADLPFNDRVDASSGWDDVVVYALGVDGDEVAYATTATSYGRSDQLVVDAFDNLGGDLIDYELIESGDGRMLVSAGEPMAAERALSEGSMLMAHEKLDANEIAVSVARRGSLLACALDSDEEVRKTLTSIHHETYREAVASGQEIFDRLLVFQDGYLSGLLDIEMSSNGQQVDWHVAGS
jgi:hypothetical protein